MRKALLVLLACVLVSAAFGVGTQEAQSKPTLAVLFPGSVEFFMVQRKGMDEAAAKLGVNLIYADAEWDAGKQLSQVENFVARKVDAILLCAADNEALIPAVAICQKAKIPLITFTNALGPNPDGKYPGVVTFVGVNEVDLGRLMGKMAEQLLGKQEKANIVLIEGNPGTAPQRMRSQGFKEVVAKHPGWSIVYSQAIPGWTKEGALAAMEAFLQTGQKVDLVSCQWYAAASAAAEAILEKKLPYKVFVTGLEFAKELIPYIQDGKVNLTTNYSIADVGYKTVEAAFKHLKGQTLPAMIAVDLVIVGKDNLASIVPEM